MLQAYKTNYGSSLY